MDKTVRVPERVHADLVKLADGRPLGQTIDRLVKSHGGEISTLEDQVRSLWLRLAALESRRTTPQQHTESDI